MPVCRSWVPLQFSVTPGVVQNADSYIATQSYLGVVDLGNWHTCAHRLDADDNADLFTGVCVQNNNI